MRSFPQNMQPAWAKREGRTGLPVLVFWAHLEVAQFQAKLLTLGVQVSLLPCASTTDLGERGEAVT